MSVQGEPSSIKQARQTGFLLTQGETAHYEHLTTAWAQECDRNGWPKIRVSQKEKLADLRYVLTESSAKA